MSMNRREAFQAMGLSAGGLAVPFGAPSLACGGEHKMAEHSMPPVENIHLYFCGFHVAKTNPSFQIETQHYCVGHGQEMHQCVLYDKHEKNAKLLGVEYIITDNLYQQLPEEEKKYWHVHTYEVMSGALIAPHMKQKDEDAFMKALINTWGKAWHTWPNPNTVVPMGDPMLMWSLTGDGQSDNDMVARRDKRMGVDTQKIRERRIKDLGFPVPNVPQPKNMNFIGRKWTASGPDTPDALK